MLSGSHPRAALNAAPGRWAGVCLLSSVLLLLGLARPALAQTTCTSSSPAVNGFTDDLVADCNTLLEDIKDDLRGMATLNWAENLSILSWDGIIVGGTPVQVTGLNLPDKNLNGTIPAELGALTSLTTLNLSDNRLTGPIPTELGALTALTHLYLYGNALTGAIPELSLLTALTQLNLAKNDLAGPIPAALGGLTSLINLNLAGNDLSGPITALKDLPLTFLYLYDTQWSGTIPQELLDRQTGATLTLRTNRRPIAPVPPVEDQVFTRGEMSRTRSPRSPTGTGIPLRTAPHRRTAVPCRRG